MSITTQEAMRNNKPSERPPTASHHEPEERYSYDPEHPYVFGDVSQFKRDGAVGQIGTVIAKFQVEAGGEVANVVYVSHLNPLYFIPAEFFRPSREEMDYYQVSNSQRRKRAESYSIMDVVAVGTRGGFEVSWAMRASRNFSRKIDYHSTKGFIGLETNAVISSQPCRQLWTEEFGLVQVDDEIGRIISDRLPNLVYKAVFQLVTSVDFAQMDPRDVKLDECGKYDGYTFKLQELERLEEVHTELVYQVPWNSEIDAPPADFTYIVEDDFDFEKKATKKEKTKNKLVETMCVVLAESELYSDELKHDRVVAPKARNFPYMLPGNILWARLLYSEMNECYVVAGAYPDERCSRVATESDASGQTKFLIKVEKDPACEPLLYGGTFGLIADPRKLLHYAHFNESYGAPSVWVIYEPSLDQASYFSVVAVPEGGRR